MSSATGASGTGSPRSASAGGRGLPPSSRRHDRRMILTRYYLGCLAHASYLIGDEASQTAVVIDPQRDVGQYLQDAQQHGLRIRHVFLTHFHADFIAGHLELRDCEGASICLGARAKAEHGFAPFKE